MIGTESKRTTISMAQNGRHSSPVDFNCPMRVDIVELAKIGCNFTRFFVDLGKVIGIRKTILTNLKLNPARVTGTFLPRTTSPRAIIPWHRLHSSNRSICQLTDPAVQSGLVLNMIPVVVILIHAKQRQKVRLVGIIVTGLHIPFQPRVVRSGAMPQDSFDCHCSGTPVASALCLHTHQGFITFGVLHRASSFLSCCSKLVIIPLPILSPLLLDANTLICWLLIVQQYSIGRL